MNTSGSLFDPGPCNFFQSIFSNKKMKTGHDIIISSTAAPFFTPIMISENFCSRRSSIGFLIACFQLAPSRVSKKVLWILKIRWKNGKFYVFYSIILYQWKNITETCIKLKLCLLMEFIIFLIQQTNKVSL